MNTKNCVSCLDFNIDRVVESKSSSKPTWLLKTDFVQEFIDNTVDFKNSVPDNANVVLKLKLNKKFANRKLLYWASDSKKRLSDLNVLDARKAYADFNNNGITIVDKNGNINIKFRCPQIYSAKTTHKSKPKTYFRHLHFVVSDINRKRWLPTIYTKIVVCKFDLATTLRLLKSGTIVLINALPCEYYAKDHIPGSYNLYYKDIKKMNQSEIHNWFHNLVKVHYPKIYKNIHSKKLNISEIPIVTYCAHSKCNASHLAIEELMKKGFVNVNEYDGGMKEYRKKFPQEK